MKKIGEILVENKHLSEEKVKLALEIQQIYGGKIGSILVSEKMIDEATFLSNLSKQLNITFIEDINLLKVNKSLLKQQDIANYLENKFIPLNENTILTAEYNASFKNQKVILTTSANIINIVVENFSTIALKKAINELEEKAPRKSIKNHLQQHGIRKFVIFFLSLLTLGIVFNEVYFAILLLLNCYFLGLILLKFTGFIVGFFQCKKAKKQTLPKVDLKNLPIYSILVPLYKEKKQIIENLIKSLNNLNYPKAKLDILLVVEEGDEKTISFVENAKENNMRIVKVPDCHPKTKPKALNYAVNFAIGKYLCIYDAEDVPDKNQLLYALEGFKKSNFLQAQLSFYNSKDNILTKFFCLEYDFLFKFYLRFLEKVNLVLPLGGTSNHIKTSSLKEIHGWDSFNVTEDADLSFRAFEVGQKVCVINSQTLEEAPNSIKAWFNQRVRWIKGHIQTFLVHEKEAKFKLKNYINLYFVLGSSSILYICIPFLILLFGAKVLMQVHIPNYIFNISLISFFSYIIINTIIYVFLSIYLKKYHLILPSFFIWIYFWLSAVACIFALKELVVQPFFWRKTEHGLSRNAALDLKT